MNIMRTVIVISVVLWAAISWSQSESQSNSAFMDAITEALYIPTDRVQVRRITPRSSDSSSSAATTLSRAQVKSLRATLTEGKLPACQNLGINDGECASLGQCGVCVECAGKQIRPCSSKCTQAMCRICPDYTGCSTPSNKKSKVRKKKP